MIFKAFCGRVKHHRNDGMGGGRTNKEHSPPPAVSLSHHVTLHKRTRRARATPPHTHTSLSTHAHPPAINHPICASRVYKCSRTPVSWNETPKTSLVIAAEVRRARPSLDVLPASFSLRIHVLTLLAHAIGPHPPSLSRQRWRGNILVYRG